jgi:hypothetical protein
VFLDRAGDASAEVEPATSALVMFTGQVLRGAGTNDWL